MLATNFIFASKCGTFVPPGFLCIDSACMENTPDIRIADSWNSPGRITDYSTSIRSNNGFDDVFCAVSTVLDSIIRVLQQYYY